MHRDFLEEIHSLWTKMPLFSSAQLLKRVWLFVIPWTAACQASLSLPTPGVYPNSSPSSWWYHPTISSSVVPFSSCLQSWPASGSFPMSQLHIRWPKYWSFSFNSSPANEHSWLVSFRMDWLDLLETLNIPFLMLGKTEGRREEGDRGWDGWMVSSTQWTWVWANSRR